MFNDGPQRSAVAAAAGFPGWLRPSLTLRRRLVAISHLLLGWALFKIYQGEQLAGLVGLRAGEFRWAEENYAFDLSLLSPFVRAVLVALICLLWQLAVRTRRRQRTVGTYCLAAAWASALLVALTTAGVARYWAKSATENLWQVIDEARSHQGDPPWAGTVEQGDGLTMDVLALTPGGRFARYTKVCTGFRRLEWGHVVHEPPFMRLAYQQPEPGQASVELLAERFLIGYENVWGSPERVRITVGELQRALLNEKHGIEGSLVDPHPDRYDVDTVRVARQQFAAFLGHEPVVAQVIESNQELGARTLLYQTRWQFGTLDRGRTTGLLPGMVFCPVPPTCPDGSVRLMLTEVADRTSRFVVAYSSCRIPPHSTWSSDCGRY